MTGEHSDAEERRVSPRAAAYVVVALALLAMPLVGVAGASAPAATVQANETNTTIEDVAPYYANHSGEVENESWMAGATDGNDPSAIVTMLSRVMTFVIGSDSGSSGALLMGMLLFGSLLGFVIDVSVGLIGGGVLAMLSLFGVVAIGLAPAWLVPVALFGIGMILATTFRGVFR